MPWSASVSACCTWILQAQDDVLTLPFAWSTCFRHMPAGPLKHAASGRQPALSCHLLCMERAFRLHYLGEAWIQRLGPQAVSNGLRPGLQRLVGSGPVAVQHSSKGGGGAVAGCHRCSVACDCLAPCLPLEGPAGRSMFVGWQHKVLQGVMAETCPILESGLLCSCRRGGTPASNVVCCCDSMQLSRL